MVHQGQHKKASKSNIFYFICINSSKAEIFLQLIALDNTYPFLFGSMDYVNSVETSL